MLDFLLRLMDIIERVRTMSEVSDIAMIGFAILLVFGFINCILGYRLLRFWMMIFGFIIGAGLGLGAAFTMGGGDRFTLIAAAVGVGVVLAVIVFLSYKVGIFVLGAGLGLGLGVYVLHPTTSLMFFLCILLGVLLGSLAMKWAREVIIVGTSILGGAMAGVSLAKLGGLEDIPYGILLSIAFAVLGMMIQFATNRRKHYEDEEEEEEAGEEKRSSRRKRTEDEYSDGYRDDRREKEETPRKRRTDTEDEKAGRRQPDISKRRQKGVSGRYRQVDYKINDGRVRDRAPEFEKTIEYRPRRKDPELDLPLDSFDRDGYGAYAGTGARKTSGNLRSRNRSFAQYQSDPRRDYRKDYGNEDRYDPYTDDDDYWDDYEDSIDEEAIDEEILKEMMEEEDRKTDLFWKKLSGKKNRDKKENGKRSKNQRNEDA